MMLTRLWVITALVCFQSSLQTSVVGNKYCAELPKPLNVSVQACWEKTMELKEMIGKSGAVVIGTCANVDNKADIKELGRYLIDGFINLRCLVMAQMKLLSITEIELVNRIDMLMVEITGDPMICLDFNPQSHECPKDMPEDLYSATALLSRVLENLYMRLAVDEKELLLYFV
ncbi:hypothetical protein ACHWQZ_G002801 [Mnemiopsis leidyi]